MSQVQCCCACCAGSLWMQCSVWIHTLHVQEAAEQQRRLIGFVLVPKAMVAGAECRTRQCYESAGCSAVPENVESQGVQVTALCL
jgi:hypothetical protein